MTVVRKIKNKERCAYRGPKARYAVWRAELNQEWERIYKLRCETICADNGLNIEDFKSSERRNTWEHTRDNLEAKGYRCLSKSWRDLQYEDEINQLYAKAEASRDFLV